MLCSLSEAANNVFIVQPSYIVLMPCLLSEAANVFLSYIGNAFERNSSKGHALIQGQNPSHSPTPSLRALENGASSMEALSK